MACERKRRDGSGIGKYVARRWCPILRKNFYLGMYENQAEAEAVEAAWVSPAEHAPAEYPPIPEHVMRYAESEAWV